MPETVPKTRIVDTLAAELQKLTPEQRAELAKRITPPREPSPFEVPRDAAGGIVRSMPFDDVLERLEEMGKRDWESPNRYYFSALGQCFRKRWWEAKGVTPDDGLPLKHPKSKYRFDPGKSQIGIGVENHFQSILEEVYGYGKAGPILKNVRMSETIQVPMPDGTVHTIYAAGKSDQLLAGDNLDILNFYEVKAPEFWPDKKSNFTARYGKVVPLSQVKIEEPMATEGLANINQLLQLSAGVHMLRKKGLSPKETTLFYVSRNNMRDHIEVKLSHEDAEFLHDFAIWWIMEHHTNLQAPTPPAPQYFMGWECRNCPFQQRCKATGGQRQIHPSMIGINAQLAAANGHESTSTNGMHATPIEVQA